MQLRIGSHLAVWCGMYWHHGIYGGNNRVIHYSGYVSTGGEGVVQWTSLDKFEGGGNAFVIEHDNPKYPGIKAVERAMSRLNEEEYCVAFNNCEHFVYWCLTGHAESKQVDFVERLMLEGGGLYMLRRAGYRRILKLVDVETLKSCLGSPLLTSSASQYLAGKAVEASMPLISSYAQRSIATTAVTSVIGSTVGAPAAVAVAAVGLAVHVWKKFSN
ncbi:hypothetical protein FEE59_22110 [Herbaspirillum sp. RU 5E]|nr:hypothetical protein [Herbaspirillum sp. RU 5E]